MQYGNRYYARPAAAFVRSTLPGGEELLGERAQNDEWWIERGLEAGLKLQRFKRSSILPRVRRVIGFLQGVRPTSLLDVGTGRGAFLWPLLDRFPDLDVTCVDVLPHRVEMIDAVREGGVANLRAVELDITVDDLPSTDVVTVLEVLEHLRDPRSAIESICRAARRFAVASVPSKPDDNPEHVQLFGPGDLERLFLESGALRVSTDRVLNHRMVFATLADENST